MKRKNEPIYDHDLMAKFRSKNDYYITLSENCKSSQLSYNVTV